MPHLIIECSENILQLKSAEEIMQNVHDSAESTELFDLGDIKVRINTFPHCKVGNTKDDFIHIFGNVMEGRTTEQKSNLSKEIIKNLKIMFPKVTTLSMNIRDFEKATYCNTNMI
ncbi:MAG: 5-carboxymethyl-2-hydroxymuconate Delta-isomerase [Flavobacterium sp.]|nr:5-carboxymethyl-2-hydroxymuconate Delta-isomerase [Flavobacterium sp.]